MRPWARALLGLVLATLAATPGRAQADSITDLVAARDDLSTLAAALQAAGLADLVEQLGDPTLAATLFLPSNAAFERLASDLSLSDAALLDDTALLASVIPYHVVPGESLRAEQLEGGQVLDTLLGGPEGRLRFELSASGQPSLATSSGQLVAITTTDLAAGEATVHIIDEVLIPEETSVGGLAPAPAPEPAPAPAPAPEPSPSPPSPAPPSPAPPPPPSPPPPSPPSPPPPSPPPPSPPPPPPPPPAVCTHTVEAGEFVESIANDYGITSAELLERNPQISNPNSIQLGAQLDVPCL